MRCAEAGWQGQAPRGTARRRAVQAVPDSMQGSPLRGLMHRAPLAPLVVRQAASRMRCNSSDRKNLLPGRLLAALPESHCVEAGRVKARRRTWWQCGVDSVVCVRSSPVACTLATLEPTHRNDLNHALPIQPLTHSVPPPLCECVCSSFLSPPPHPSLPPCPQVSLLFPASTAWCGIGPGLMDAAARGAAAAGR